MGGPRLTLVVGLVIELASRAALAQWVPMGTLIGSQIRFVYSDDGPQAASDGSGGIWATWTRNYSSSGSLPVLQHVLPNGTLPLQWTAPGVTPWEVEPFVTDGPSRPTPDGLGGAYVLVQESVDAPGPYQLLLRMTADGEVAPPWPARGVPLANQPWQQLNGILCRDDAHGVIAAWNDAEGGTRAQAIHAKRITPDATLAPGWPAGGLVIATGPHDRTLEALVGDGAGGAYFVWDDLGDSRVTTLNFVVMAQHITADGQVFPGWPVGGIPVTTASHLQDYAKAVPDGAGGLIVTWEDDRSTPDGDPFYNLYGDIYATRLQPDGTRAPGWPAEGLPVCTAIGAQYSPTLCTDGAGGAVIAWADDRTSYGEVYMNRILADGSRAPGWTSDGVRVADNSVGASDVRVASDAQQGAYVCWYNATQTQRAFAQHMRGNGLLATGWASFGTLMVDLVLSGQYNLSLEPAERGNAIMVWTDLRQVNGHYEQTIRAQKLLGDGPVPVQLALVTANASADAVQLEWRGDRAAFAGAHVERSGLDGAWQPLGAPVNDGADILRYEDRAVVAGARYAYRLVDASGNVLVAPTWVDVPAATRFALAGATPNPSRAGDLAVRFSLPVRASGTLELLDLAGRRRAYRELGAMEPGEHLERMAETAGFAPGLYWLRLQQGGKSATSRVALTP